MRERLLTATAVAATILTACTSIGTEGEEPCGKCDDTGDTEVSLSTETVTVYRDYRVDEPGHDNQFTTRYHGVGRHPYQLKLLKVANGRLALYFIIGGSTDSLDTSGDGQPLCAAQAAGPDCRGEGSAPYGARLYRAVYTAASPVELLYTNGDGKVSPNWGPRAVDNPDNIIGWLGLGGAEAAFPVDEHGFYSATTWQWSYERADDGSVTFTSSTVGAPGNDGGQRDRVCGNADSCALDVSVSYTLRPSGAAWKTKISITNPSSTATVSKLQYWHNYMLPAGHGGNKHRVEVLLPEMDTIEVHSTGDGDLKNHTAPADGAPGILGDGGHARHWFRSCQNSCNGAAEAAARKVSLIHGPGGDTVSAWLGLFAVKSRASSDGRVTRYGFYNHDRRIGLGMVASSSGDMIYPKSFGGPGIGPGNWTNEDSRYVEMWYSPNVRSFWDGATLAPGQTMVHETLVAPLAVPEDLENLAADMDAYRPTEPEQPDPSNGVSLGSWSGWQERNSSSIAFESDDHTTVSIRGDGNGGFNGGAYQRVCGLAGKTLRISASVSWNASAGGARWTQLYVMRDGSTPQNGSDVGADGNRILMSENAGTIEFSPSDGGDCSTLLLKAGTAFSGEQSATFADIVLTEVQ